jgi:hypothetical protein
MVNRPREILEVLCGGHKGAEFYSPAPSPTFAFPVLDFVEKGPAAVLKYRVLNSFRPWWASMRHLDSRSRPVNLSRTLILLASLGAAGAIFLSLGLAGPRDQDVDGDFTSDQSPRC